MNSVVNTLRRVRYSVALIGLLLVVLVSACGPVHTEPRWASISSVAGGSQILLAFGDRLSLVDAEDGRAIPLLDSDGEARLDDQGNPRVWEVRWTGEGMTRFYSNPIFLNEETMLAASYDQKLVEIDFPVARVDGDTAATTQHIVAAPVRDGDLIYVGLSDHDLVAYDAEDLTEAWRIVTEHGVWSEPIVVEDVVYFTSMDHFLYAANKNSGELLWKTNLEGAMTAAPVYSDGHLYVGTFANKIFDVNAETGEVNSEYPISGWIWNPPTLVDGTLYVSDLAGMVYALNTVDGDLSEIWQARVSEKGLPPSPLVTEDFIIVGSRDNNVYWLNRADGSVAETRPVAGEVLANLLLVEPSETVDISESLVVVSTASPEELLVAFTLDNAERVWAYKR